MESVSSKYEITRGNKLTKGFSIFTIIFIIFLISTPWWLGRADIRKVTEFLYILSIAQMWNLLAGYGGLVSVGQQLFIGIGAYCLVIFSYKLGIDPFLVIPIAGLVSLIVGYFVSKVAFRLKGVYFAVGTWVLAETFRLLFSNSSWLGGGSGLSITKTMKGIPTWWRESLTLWFAILLGIGSVILVNYLLRSKYGISLTAVRDNEVASESLGIKVKKVKLFVYLTAAFVTGMAGALIFITKLRVSPEAAFSIEWTVIMFFIVVIGGIGTIEGPIIGTIVYITMRETMDDLGTWYLIVLGLFTIIIMIKAPQGLWGLIKSKFNNIHFFAIKRHVKKRE
ncbi:branched-chain amino acid ABC transporter permease [Poseidonibacter ostreae]|uniref:Branched-chain amino acid ABC transporter permease n=1 Tax=Poseidonibacter ostreae TaxID=2654171 RepID=A0A6L4WN77_9BACT|nr:branched-chain amino acid ABC transporter permease [Poseidonibacter ostreae]KAB7884484.1 branched-chain amino acid ABC transporter permease [Poseidonibacter ostreae]KAB7884580.1 branched-chain amino acid ABC transporter permease [Poseidonibacter ostreae]KAB7888061.1 branched-chain amino acid ABC transporter permease [Poseidonibacter ostreae]